MSAASDWADFLEKGEHVLWQGQPAGNFLNLERRDLLLVPFSIAWAGIAVPIGGIIMVAGIAALLDGSPLGLVPICFGGVFFFVGLYMTIGRFAHDYLTRRSTWYALSNKRAFIATSLLGKTLRTKAISVDTEIGWEDGKVQRIRFGAPSRSGARLVDSFEFRNLTDGKRVLSLVYAIQRGET
ncbi:hypothetical protein [Actibacterium ureilyticum]|uniref:hypothetical protein n=1 Tax=Actibacterium ureilyticum TaxID=1590614 RepID=UPI001140D953|nr:hypothetical protein [Actibacterium ureilyticum]